MKTKKAVLVEKMVDVILCDQCGAVIPLEDDFHARIVAANPDGEPHCVDVCARCRRVIINAVQTKQLIVEAA